MMETQRFTLCILNLMYFVDLYNEQIRPITPLRHYIRSTDLKSIFRGDDKMQRIIATDKKGATIISIHQMSLIAERTQQSILAQLLVFSGLFHIYVSYTTLRHVEPCWPTVYDAGPTLK